MARFDLGFTPHESKTDRPGYLGTSLQEFYAAFPNNEACLEHMFLAKFVREGCPRCGEFGDWRRVEGARSYQHQLCRTILSPTAGTLMNGTQIELQIWFYAMLHFSNSSHGASRTFIARHLGIADFSAFRMARRIRFQMAALDDETKLGGLGKTVFIRFERVRPIIRRRKGRHGYARILVLNDGESVRTAVIGLSKPGIARNAVFEKTKQGSILVTDCQRTFDLFEKYLIKPTVRFHPSDLDPSMNLQNLHYSFLKYCIRQLRLQHVGVSYHRLWLYLKEAEFRFSRRKRSKETFWDLVGQFPLLTPETKLILESKNVFGVDISE